VPNPYSVEQYTCRISAPFATPARQPMRPRSILQSSTYSTPSSSLSHRPNHERCRVCNLSMGFQSSSEPKRTSRECGDAYFRADQIAGRTKFLSICYQSFAKRTFVLPERFSFYQRIDYSRRAGIPAAKSAAKASRAETFALIERGTGDKGVGARRLTVRSEQGWRCGSIR
jgi:hypothetical protein